MLAATLFRYSGDGISIRTWTRSGRLYGRGTKTHDMVGGVTETESRIWPLVRVLTYGSKDCTAMVLIIHYGGAGRPQATNIQLTREHDGRTLGLSSGKITNGFLPSKRPGARMGRSMTIGPGGIERPNQECGVMWYGVLIMTADRGTSAMRLDGNG